MHPTGLGYTSYCTFVLSEMEHPWEKAAEEIERDLPEHLENHQVFSTCQDPPDYPALFSEVPQNIGEQSALWVLHGQNYKELLVDIFKAFSLKVKW